MATTFEASRAPAIQQTEIVGQPNVADPAALGLAGFALTTFLLSAANAGWLGAGTGNEWLGYAFAYGGIAQFCAGMWEFRNRNVFGSTAFGTYGAFWIGLALYIELVAPHAKAAQVNNDLGWILLAFFIFNSYMLLWSVFVNVAVFGVFLSLDLTEALLFVGFLSGTTTMVKAGGIVGVICACIAWYTAAAGVLNGMAGRHLVPVGKPLPFPGARAQLR